MNAILLAAGRGTRMGTLTDNCPKPLLTIKGQHLIEYHLYALATAGIQRIVVNIAYHGEKIKQALGDGNRYGVEICYSDEGKNALETAGGIKKALPLLGKQAFWVVNGDIWTDYCFSQRTLTPTTMAHLILVPNPAHHTHGDFALADERVNNDGAVRLTYSGIGIYHPDLFLSSPSGSLPLAPVLRQACDQGLITGECYTGTWLDVGTPERLVLAKTLAKR